MFGRRFRRRVGGNRALGPIENRFNLKQLEGDSGRGRDGLGKLTLIIGNQVAEIESVGAEALDGGGAVLASDGDGDAAGIQSTAQMGGGAVTAQTVADGGVEDLAEVLDVFGGAAIVNAGKIFGVVPIRGDAQIV